MYFPYAKVNFKVYFSHRGNTGKVNKVNFIVYFAYFACVSPMQ
jgi:hypothetical protein